MVTDNQRREVAQELRKLTAPGCIRYAEEFYEELREIVARDLDGSFEGVANSLADLIEPEPERTCKVTHEYSGKQFPHCIHVKELSCGHEFRYYEPSHVPNYCPECGARVVS